jgi:hypothetical protein
LYQSANLDSREIYSLKGTRGTVNYLGFGTQSGSYGQSGGLQTVMYIDYSDPEFATEADGSFEIVLSAEKPEGAKNWLQLKVSYICG